MSAASRVQMAGIALFKAHGGEFYWADDGTSTLYYTVGGAWSSIATPRVASSGADIDRATGLLYVRTYRELGFFAFDPASLTFPAICDDTTTVGENSRTGIFFRGEFFTREYSNNYMAFDVNRCNRRDN